MKTTPQVILVTIKPAIMTPSKIAGIAERKGIFNNADMIAPVQAPVPGKGIATNKHKPIFRYFSTTSLLL